MSEVIDPININQAATEFAVTMAVLGESPDTPLARWIEYRAYSELVEMLRKANELPADYTVFIPEAHSIRDWLLTGKGLKRRFSEEALHLFAQVQDGGSSVIDNICRFYCKWKKTKWFVIPGASLLLAVDGIADFLVAAAFLGLPPIALITFFLSAGEGLLDKCDCGAD